MRQYFVLRTYTYVNIHTTSRANETHFKDTDKTQIIRHCNNVKIIAIINEYFRKGELE